MQHDRSPQHRRERCPSRPHVLLAATGAARSSLCLKLAPAGRRFYPETELVRQTIEQPPTDTAMTRLSLDYEVGDRDQVRGRTRGGKPRILSSLARFTRREMAVRIPTLRAGAIRSRSRSAWRHATSSF
jgi:hypothetical protein